MAKKKKKTLASTRKSSKQQQSQKEPEKKGKLFNKKKMTRAEKRAAKRAEKEMSKKQSEPAKKKETAEKVLESFEKEAKAKIEKSHKKEKKQKASKPKMAPEKKQKIRGGILASIGLFALIFMGWFLFGKMFRPSFLAELLPIQKTIAVLEINVDPATGQPQQFFDTLKNAPIYSQQNVSNLLKTQFPLPLNGEELWLGRRVGMILYAITNKDGSKNIEPVFFAESRDHQKTLESLSQLGLKTLNGEEIYEQAQGGAAFMFLGNYLAAAQDVEVLKDIAQSQAAPRLTSDPNYQKVANNLPQGGILFGYLSTRDLFQTLQHNQVFTAQKGQDFLAFQPFLELFPSEGVTVLAADGKFTAQMFTVIDKEKLDGEGFLTFSEKYRGDLLALAGDNPIFIAGGHDLTKEMNRLEEVFRSGTKTSSLIFDGLLEAQKQRYFGKDISLKEDVLPLLTGEYLLTVENNFEEPVVTFILQLPNGSADVLQLEKLVSSFVQASGVFTPTIQTVTLPDGTVGREVVASPEEIQRQIASYDGKTVDVLTIGDTGLSVYLTILNDKAIFTTSQDSLQNIVDRSTGRQQARFTDSKYYQNGMQPLIRTSDEIVHLKVGALIEALQLAETEAQEYLLPFTNFTFGRNYFDDGISTITVVNVLP